MNSEYEMHNDRDQTIMLLKALADCLSQSSDRALNELANGTAKLVIVSSKVGNWRTQPSPKQPRFDEEEISKILGDLGTLNSRDDGKNLLQKHAPGRRYLELIAKKLDMPVRKEENIERLRDRIVESTIGSRLNSRAIRGDQAG
jgi:hypothetical protein